MRTENSAAAQMLAEAESRLAQMLENSGLKLGMFNTFTGGDGRQAGQNNNGNDGQKNGAGNTSEAGADDSGGLESANAENDETRVNITA
jgi:flagellar hook-length control protein FliK